VRVDQKNYGKVTADRIHKIVKEYRPDGKEIPWRRLRRFKSCKIEKKHFDGDEARPSGNHVCGGTGCLSNGAEQVVEALAGR